jgi:hypothetical protein
VGDIKEWAAKRSRRYGDLILAKHMVIDWVYGDRHNTAWIEHTGVDQDTGEHFHSHHLACDCIRSDGGDGLDGEVAEFCPMAHNALAERAHMIDREYRIHETLSSLAALELTEDEKQETYHDIVLTAMEETLIEDHRRPERWMANIVSGQHNINLIGEILHIPPETIQMYAGILELQGKVDLDGPILKFKEAA